MSVYFKINIKMKKIILIGLLISFVSCNSQDKKTTIILDIEVAEFQQLISKKNVQLIDVRTPVEFKKGHLKNAKLINFFDKDFKSEILKKIDKNKPVYVYCKSGGRSAKAAKIYKAAGFKKVFNLLGGFNAWSASGLEIEK